MVRKRDRGRERDRGGKRHKDVIKRVVTDRRGIQRKEEKQRNGERQWEKREREREREPIVWEGVGTNIDYSSSLWQFITHSHSHTPTTRRALEGERDS